MQRNLGMPLWHWGLIILMVVGVGAGIWVVGRRTQVLGSIGRQRLSAFITVGLGVAGIAFLMVNAVEAIHYLQYAVLVLLLAQVFGRALPAFFLAIVIGVIDEWYQLYVLHPSWQPYLDYNDLVLNTIGALAGLIVLRAVSTKPEAAREWLIWALCPLVVLVLFQVDFLALYPDGGRWVLNRWNYPDPASFSSRWMDTGWGNHWFMLSWVEGFVLTWGLPWLLFRFDSKPEASS